MKTKNQKTTWQNLGKTVADGWQKGKIETFSDFSLKYKDVGGGKSYDTISQNI